MRWSRPTHLPAPWKPFACYPPPTHGDDDAADGYQFLSMAWHRKGNEAKAMVAAAQSLFASGRYVEARTQASRAQAKVKEGSPEWLKADDILNYRPPKFD